MESKLTAKTMLHEGRIKRKETTIVKLELICTLKTTIEIIKTNILISKTLSKSMKQRFEWFYACMKA